MARIFVNHSATRYGFIDKESVETVCQVAEIKSKRVIEPKQIQEFDNSASKSITPAIYFTLNVSTYTESSAIMLITNL